MARITKVYTRTGDQGQTSLVTGERVSKASLRVEAYGAVDELNSFLGLARTKITGREIQKLYEQIQNDLFVLGADLATPMETAEGAPIALRRITAAEVARLEKEIDHHNAELPELKEFILPTGNEAGSLLHIARAVARRAERAAVHLAEAEKVSGPAIVYLNRLSDLLFVLARVANRQGGSSEIFAKYH